MSAQILEADTFQLCKLATEPYWRHGLLILCVDNHGEPILEIQFDGNYRGNMEEIRLRQTASDSHLKPVAGCF
jgi:hypothetical protein